MKCLRILIAVLLSAATNVGAAIIHVPAEQPTIQAGIDAASDGDTVIVADGSYSGPGNNEINPLGKAVFVCSANGPSQCRIDPSLGGLSTSVLVINSGEDSLTIFKGFTISQLSLSGGKALTCENASPQFIDCVFESFISSAFYGGAIYVKHGSPKFDDCQFRQNGTKYGGAIAVDTSGIMLRNCLFDSNYSSGLGYVWGGAIWIGPNSSAMIMNTVFSNNGADDVQLVGDARGGAIYCGLGSELQVDSSEFSGNIAYFGMGGAIFADGASVNISSSVFDSNGQHNLPPALSAGAANGSLGSMSTVPKSYASGGAIYGVESAINISDCVFSNNQAPYFFPVYNKYRGGAICSDRCTTLLSGSTFVDNAARTGYAIFAFESVLRIDSSIIAFNREIYPGQGAPIACDTFSNVSVSVTCTDIYGNPNGNWLELVDSLETLYNNFSLDPQFCGRLVGNYHLQEDSPCRPELSTCGSLVGALPVEPWCNSCCEGTTGDWNLSGRVDLSDLSALLMWLTFGHNIPPCFAEANVDTNGSIDLSDLSAIIAYLTAGTYTLPWCP